MISAILLAAGESKRMNGENKLTKIINDDSLIKHSVKNLLESDVDELIIIIGHEAEKIKKLIDENNKIKFFFNNDYKTGMASSIKVGLNNLSENTKFFFICLADMPMINREIYNKLIKYSENKKIVVPTYKNQQANPVLFPTSLKNKIMDIQGDTGAKKVLELNKDKIVNVNINDIGLIKDFDSSSDFNY